MFDFEIRFIKPVSKSTNPNEQAELVKMTNGKTEMDARAIVEGYIDKQNVELPRDCGIPDLTAKVTKKALQGVQAALNAMLWLPLKLVSAVQFALAPALPVSFNLRRLRGIISILSVEWFAPLSNISPLSKLKINLF